MKLLIVICMAVGLALGAVETDSNTVFVTEPQDAWVRPGATVQLDCELAASSKEDICAWRITGTHLDVDHFYNVAPPDKVRPLFPEHERICSVLIEDADWRHDGFWTCWPLAVTSHVSSRDARLVVADDTTPAPTSPTETARTTAETTTREPSTETTSSGTTYIPTTTTPPVDTTTELPQTTTEPATSTSAAPPTSVATTTVPPPTTTPAATTTVAPPTTTEEPFTTVSPSPSPEFTCPHPYGLFADPNDTRYFYFCEDGIAIHMQCESPQHWDDARKTCV